MSDTSSFVLQCEARVDTSKVAKTLAQKKLTLQADVQLSKNSKKFDTAIKRWQKLTRDTASIDLDKNWTKVNTEIKTGLTAINKFDKEVKNCSQQTETFKNNFGDVVQRITVMNKYGTALSSNIVEMKNGVQQLTTTTETVTKNVKGLANTVGIVRAEVTTVTKEIQTGKGVKQIQEVTTSYKDMNGRLVTLVEQYENLNGQLVKVGTTTRNITNENQKLGQSFTDVIGKVAKFYLATLPIQAMQKAISETSTVVKDFDKAITEMGKVSEYSGEQLKNYTRELADMGTQVGRTMTEMTDATTGWIKAGYSEDDAKNLAVYSALLQNTADEQLDASEATSILVSQLKAYHMEAEDAVKVTDIINKVSAEQAVSSGDIAKGLTQASASMSTFGNSIEQTTALLTAGTTIFQGKSQQVKTRRLFNIA